MASYSDNFNRANNESLGADWTEWNQDDNANVPFEIKTNEARATGENDFKRYYARYDTALTDESHSVTATLKAWGGAGATWYVWGLYINGDTAAGTDETMLLLQIRNDGNSRLYLLDGGSFTQLDTVASVPAIDSVMVISRDGADVSVTDDGVEILSATLTAGQQTTLSGRDYGGMFYTSGHNLGKFDFDDFTIADAGVATPETWVTHPQPLAPGAIINITDSLASGLSYGWFCNEYGGYPVSRRESNPDLRFPQAVIGDGGDWGLAGFRVNNGGLAYPRYHGMNWTDTASVTVHLTVHSLNGTGDVGIISKRNDTGDWWALYTDGTDIIFEWSASGTGTVTFSGAWPGTGTHSIILSRNSTAPQYALYVDGKLFDTQTESGKPGFIADSVYSNWGTLRPGTTSDYLDATFHMAGFWIYQTLNSGAAAQMATDPWYLLRPLDAPMFSFFSDDIKIPVFMHHYRQQGMT